MARLAVSNIAWADDQNEQAFEIIRSHRACLEIAPTRLWPDWNNANSSNAKAWKDSMSIPVRSLQSLLFQKPDLQLFTGGDLGREKLFEHLTFVVDIAASLVETGKTCSLVFGSPKNRCRNDVSLSDAISISADFFRRVGEYALPLNVVICLEPNPSAYGSDFMTNVTETAHIVRLVNLPSIRLSMDTGCAYLAGDNIAEAIHQNADILGHFQISEPQLQNLSSPVAAHIESAMALHSIGYDKTISIEMKSSGIESISNLSEALEFTQRVYKNCLFVPLNIAVIGGGWFGCHLASSLVRSGHSVNVFESQSSLLSESSSKNQFRLHLGFHYPRSFNTRRHMQMHFLRFERDYPNLIENVPRNFYGIAKDCSLVDFGTYLAVMSSMGIPFKVHNPEEHGFSNLEGLISCSEKVFIRHAPRVHFETLLQSRFKCNVKIEKDDIQVLDDGLLVKEEKFDYLLNCTYNHFLPQQDKHCFYELCLTLIYVDTKPYEPEIALTIMDGQLASLYPLKENNQRKVTLTSVQYTPIQKSANLSDLVELSNSADMESQVVRRRPLFEGCISQYYPDFKSRYEYEGYFLSFKTKPYEESDNRECFVSVNNRIINVWSGKINAIYDAEGKVNEIMNANIKQTIGKTSALIGFTGFVGSTLNRQGLFSDLFNSKNIENIRGRTFDVIFCAGAPGVKWKANRFPDNDIESIQRLMDCLSTVKCRQFILISTIDVYPVSNGQAEEFPCESAHHHAYGRHRLRLEKFVLENFEEPLIVRLPALFGMGLRKNYLFDLLCNNNIGSIDPDTVFQWYDVSDLLDDITTVLARNVHLSQNLRLKIVNLFTEPIRTSDIIDRFFPAHASFTLDRTHKINFGYDLWTSYGTLFACTTQHYMRTSNEIFDKMQRFISAWRAQQASLANFSLQNFKSK